MQAIGRQPQRALDGAPAHYERHRTEQTTLYRLVQQHAASFIAHTEANSGAELPRNTQGRVRRLPRVRYPGARVPEVTLRRLRARQAAGLKLQAPRVAALRAARAGCRRPRLTWWTM